MSSTKKTICKKEKCEEFTVNKGGNYCAVHSKYAFTCVVCGTVKVVHRKPNEPLVKYCCNECRSVDRQSERALDPLMEIEHAYFYSLVRVNYRRNSAGLGSDKVGLHKMANRRCLGCNIIFRSQGPWNRRCAECGNVNDISDFRKQKGVIQIG